MDVAFLFAASFTVFCTVLLLWVPLLLRPTPGAERLLRIVQSKRQDRRTVGRRERLTERLLGWARLCRRRLGLADNAQSTRRLVEAGLRGHRATDTFFAVQGLGLFCGGALGSLIPGNTFFCILTGAIAGFMGPDLWLTARGKRRRERIRKSLPDAIDLLVICVDAGLGLDQALLRVGKELDVSHPEINEEFSRINLEQRAGMPRLDAWKALADRTKMEEFRSFVAMLTQTDRFGTPIIKALSSFAEELRMKRRQRAEEAAAKTKIKIIFPLVFCIFPCIFIVLLAPALLSIVSGMKSMGN